MNGLYVAALCVAVVCALTSTSNGKNVDSELLDLLHRFEENLEKEQKEDAQRASDSEYSLVRHRGTTLNRYKLKPAARSGPGLTSSQQTDLVNAVNDARRSIGATDMYILRWNNNLAGLGQQWADQCLDYPGVPDFDSQIVGFFDVNILTHLNPSDFDVGSSISHWMANRDAYNYETTQCYRRSCDEYLQLTWAYTTDIGCGLSSCPSGNFLVCYVNPPGNYYGEKPYTPIGVNTGPCTQCSSGHFYCNNGLCDATCTTSGSTCVCQANCLNCGTSTSDCACSCKPGSVGVDCSNRCRNTNPQCGTTEWPKSFCSNPNVFWVKQQCPKMCKVPGCNPPVDPCA